MGAGVVVAASQNRDEYQLVALTALFLAIKLFERLNIQPEHVSYLSRGRYTSDEVIKMEMVMLRALEWKVSTADKADYVEAFLDVLVCGVVDVDSKNDDNNAGDSESSPSESASSTATGTTTGNLRGLKDLANLQIQLSDFEPSFSTIKPSSIAFAAVVNAFEMKKDEMSNVERHGFLKGLKRLMNELYSYNSSRRSVIRKERKELAGIIDRLRVLVDPQMSSSSSSSRSSSIHSAGIAVQTHQVQSQEHLTPTSHQRYAKEISSSIRSSSNSSTSMAKYQSDTSPLDVALDSMESFDMAQWCCGSTSEGAPMGHPAFHDICAHAAQAVSMDEDDTMMMLMDETGSEENVRNESAASYLSASDNGNTGDANDAAAVDKSKRNSRAASTNRSPTSSIATILFGASA